VVSVHVPLTATTRRLLDGGRIAMMKPSAYLVNVARGEVVDEPALLSALQAGGIRGAALDVFEQEPLPAGHPFAGLDNVILTPHSAGTAREAVIRVMKMTAANIQRVMRGETPIDLVNGPT
jgi:phosphoglycerate dehydrogenase-like enzyme